MAARPSDPTVNRATRPGCGRSKRISIDNCRFTTHLPLGSGPQWLLVRVFSFRIALLGDNFEASGKVIY